MSFAVAPVGSVLTLVSGPVQYEFQPNAGLDVVVVTIIGSRVALRRELTTEEAREQWRRLVEQGYERQQ